MRVAWLAASVYFIVVVSTAILPMASGQSLAGVYAVLATLPWSGLFVALLDSIDPTLIDHPAISILAIVIGGTFNAAVIFWIISLIIRVRRRRQAGASGGVI